MYLIDSSLIIIEIPECFLFVHNLAFNDLIMHDISFGDISFGGKGVLRWRKEDGRMGWY